jgi:ureidoacrylate peracid hydrolase
LHPDHPGHALHPELQVEDGDEIVRKHRYSAFVPGSSELDSVLRARGIDSLILTGTTTNVCCESTARDGHMLGYRIFAVADAMSALTECEHLSALESLARYFASLQLADGMAALIEAGARG